jgi:hypothetical protein
MPEVRNSQSRARDFCEGGAHGRSRRATIVCSLFVLSSLFAAVTYETRSVEVQFGVTLVANAFSTVNGPERSVSRECEATAKRTDTAEASLTRS